jgi:hypothetical protein
MEDKELYGGTPVTTLDDTHKLSLGKTGVAGSVNITWANFKTLILNLFGTLLTSVKYNNISADFTVSLPANISLYYIHMRRISGTPIITIGNTLAGVEYLDSTTVADTFGCNLFTPINDTSTIYISISGGNANFNVTYKTNNL